MKESVIKRVIELIESRGVTPRGFASEIDFNYSTLNNYITGRRKAIDVSLIESIISSFGNVSAEWFSHYDLSQTMAIIHFTNFRY